MGRAGTDSDGVIGAGIGVAIGGGGGSSLQRPSAGTLAVADKEKGEEVVVLQNLEKAAEDQEEVREMERPGERMVEKMREGVGVDVTAIEKEEDRCVDDREAENNAKQ
ncbi:hypothetical protein GJ744_000467 [Endocarpon pusillum]|uniref:Uncharacterized protein n=1 Tax=Endocarpon pusillum TaxID=364733 RepID=A0A8H7E3Z5_9EURO|nr:hypothetical protein GJ744_000467 [Endocarpon pusillum]